MAKRIILLSGPVSAGKTKLGDKLASRYDFKRLKTRELLSALGIDSERQSLQTAGAEQDRKTNGAWGARRTCEARR